MPLVAVLERFGATAFVAMALFGCSGESAESTQGASEPPSYQKSPIMVSTYNGNGTYMLSLEAPTPVLHNSYPDVSELSPSPSRRSVFQKSHNGNAAELFALEPNGRLLTSLPPDRLLGWTSDDVLLLITSTGLLRVSADGTSMSEVPFPVDRLAGTDISLSPDGSVFVFGDATAGTGLQFVDTKTGDMLERSPVPNVGPLYWALDGRIALAPYNGNSIMVGTRDSGSLTTYPLNFQPCRIVGRVDPSLLEVWERIGDPATNTSCAVPWLVRTDGTLVGKDTEGRPAAFSPDRKKLLLWDIDLIVTDLDRQNPIKLPHIDQISGPTVW
jgi:hypothetical protein